MNFAILGFAVFIFIIFLATAVRVVQEYERGVIFRLGRVIPTAKGPGLFFLVPFIDRMVKVNLQIVTLDVPPQDVITKDNVTVRVNAVCYFQVFQPVKAIVEVENYLYATSQIAQTTLRAILCKVDLDQILTERDQLNQDVQRIIDGLTDPWGVKVALVEIKDVDLPVEMQRAMAKQAEAERERRAKIINAEGEFQASERLAQAAEVIARHPIAYQLRYLQTVTEVAVEKNSTLVIPIPIEMLGPFQAAFGKDLSAFDVGPAVPGARTPAAKPGSSAAPAQQPAPASKPPPAAQPAPASQPAPATQPPPSTS